MHADWFCSHEVQIEFIQSKFVSNGKKTNTEEGRKIDFDYVEQICLKYKNTYRTMQGPKYAHRLSLSRASPLLMHDLLLLAVSITIQTTSTLPAYACLFVFFWHGVEKIWISNNLFSFWKKASVNSSCRFNYKFMIKL